METPQTLADRFAAQQEKQMTLIENESTQLTDHIEYWNSVRLENVLGYYARKEGLTQLGLQPLPVLQVLEYKAKEAIKMSLLLNSLNKSEYGKEPWTLAEVSAEIVNTNPKNCFKKKPFTVTVYFDNDEKNSFPYTNWDSIYYQDDNSVWHKVHGKVDTNGLYFQEITGDIVYFALFQPDAERYGHSGQWSVKYKNTTLFTSVTSSTPGPSSTEPASQRRATTHTVSKQKTPRKRKHETDEDTDGESPSSTSSGFRLRRRRREQGESTSRASSSRRRGGNGGAVSPEEVGSRTRTVPTQGLTRLRRLQEEARDPPIIILQGCPNTLKCFRNRVSHKHHSLYTDATTVFHWVLANCQDKKESARMLIAFTDNRQRDAFLAHVTLPKGTNHWFGSLDTL